MVLRRKMVPKYKGGSASGGSTAIVIVMWLPSPVSGFSILPEKKEELTYPNNIKKIKNISKIHKNTQKNSKNRNKPTNKLVMFSANADGLNKKVHSLKYQIRESNAAIFTVQETNFKKKERLK